MPRRIINISSHLARYGESVEFFLVEPPVNNRGLLTEGASTKVIKTAAVFPDGDNKLNFDLHGTKYSARKKVYIRFKRDDTPFPVGQSEGDPVDTRMRYQGQVYRMVEVKPYPSNYYMYIAELMKVKPDDLPE